MGRGTWSQCARTRHTSPRGKWSLTPTTLSAGTTQHCISTKPLVLSFEVPNKKVIRINHVWLSGASAEGGRNSGQDVGVRCVCFRYLYSTDTFQKCGGVRGLRPVKRMPGQPRPSTTPLRTDTIWTRGGGTEEFKTVGVGAAEVRRQKQICGRNV